MSVKKVDDLERETVEAGTHAYKRVLIGADEGPHFALRRFEIEPGGSMPLHTNRVEHEQYVLQGSAEIRIGDKVHRVAKDDVIFIPANTEHSYTTVGDKPFVFICVVPNEEDQIELVEE